MFWIFGKLLKPLWYFFKINYQINQQLVIFHKHSQIHFIYNFFMKFYVNVSKRKDFFILNQVKFKKEV